MPYKNPTITEIYAELHLEADVLTEGQFFDVVPQLKKAGFGDVEFARAGLDLDLKSGLPREVKRVRCWNADRTRLVQIGEDLLVVNVLGSYPGWDEFKKLFGVARQALEQGLGEVGVQSLNLLTIDQFEVPRAGFNISRFLNTGGPVMPGWYEGCSEPLDLTMGRGRLQVDGRNRQFRVKVEATRDIVKVRIQAHFHDRVEEGADLVELLERLHDESNDTFEDLITDHLRNEVMGGRV
jgi:uncharacterized protein (TIGR04255 family)